MQKSTRIFKSKSIPRVFKCKQSLQRALKDGVINQDLFLFCIREQLSVIAFEVNKSYQITTVSNSMPVIDLIAFISEKKSQLELIHGELT